MNNDCESLSLSHRYWSKKVVIIIIIRRVLCVCVSVSLFFAGVIRRVNYIARPLLEPHSHTYTSIYVCVCVCVMLLARVCNINASA